MEFSTTILNMKSLVRDNPYFEIVQGENRCSLYYLGNLICEVSSHDAICYYEDCNDLQGFYYEAFSNRSSCERYCLLKMFDLLQSLICLQKLFSEDGFYNHVIFNIRF